MGPVRVGGPRRASRMRPNTIVRRKEGGRREKRRPRYIPAYLLRQYFRSFNKYDNTLVQIKYTFND